MIVTVAVAILILGVLVFVHELGHFLVAKYFRIGVEKFSLGFGPKLVGKKIGETEYMISAIPLGGYVKLVGQEVSDFPNLRNSQEMEHLEEKEEKFNPSLEKSFAFRPVYQRFCVVLAGPVFNLLFSVLIFWGVSLAGMPFLTPTIAKVVKGSPAANAGILAGDEVVGINQMQVNRWDELVRAVQNSEGRALEFKIIRAGQERVFDVRPKMTETRSITGQSVKRIMVGVQTAGILRIGPYPHGMTAPDPLVSIGRALQQTWGIIAQTGQAFSLIFRGIVPVRESLGGPILIGERAGWHCKAGGVNCLYFASFLSINLALLNLLPIPVLDGGHIFFYLIEAVIRRPISLKIREIAQQVGFLLILSLMFFAFYNDIMRFLSPSP